VIVATQPYTLPAFAGELVNMVAGLLLWAGHLAVVYAVHALACAHGFHERTVLGFGLVPFAIAVATAIALLGCLAVLGYALRDLRRTRGRDDVAESERFLTYTSATIAGFSILAIVWVAVPALVIAPCV
jgi:hypothetical protein